MVFVRKIKKNNSVYLAEVENHRVDGKVKQHVNYMRGTSKESIETVEKLQKENIRFTEVFSEDKYQLPVLYVKDRIYSYGGINQISSFIASVAVSSALFT